MHIKTKPTQEPRHVLNRGPTVLLHPCYLCKKTKNMHEYKATQEMHMRCSLLPLPQLVPSFHTDALPTLHLMREERRHIGIFCFLGYQNWLKDPTLRNGVCSVWSKPYLCHLLYPEPQQFWAALLITDWPTDRQWSCCWDPAVWSHVDLRDPFFLSLHTSGPTSIEEVVTC